MIWKEMNAKSPQIEKEKQLCHPRWIHSALVYFGKNTSMIGTIYFTASDL